MANLDDLFSCFGDVDTSIHQECSSTEINGRCENESQDGEFNSNKRKLPPDFKICDTSKVLKTQKSTQINKEVQDPGIVTHTISKDDGCLHEVAVPPGQKFPKLEISQNPPAKEYKFNLDAFQKQAIQCVENNQSVLVSAHTSAGKTVIAEYAIALALKNKQRVIYTTPIKALSNQKYREMLDEFKDVGIMTGDVTINPMASCLIMTTEILRAMLFKGSEITKEVGWVVFDEIHYMRDKVRGVVWEETLILLPDNVRYVFLSATIPNARQFAEWVSYLHQQPCNVVYTEYRPTPLQHYLFPINGDGMHLVIDANGKLREDNFDKAVSTLEDHNGNPSGKFLDDNKTKKDDVFNVVKVLMEKNLAPLIIFSFSKRSCEKYAMTLSKLNFNTDDEAKLVDEVFNNAIDILSETEKKLPQITTIIPLLRRGIAFHHSGILPLIKETVEILFGEGLIKALFATETFAMGLNMPAKTVIFTSSKKFDGDKSRYISSGEYIQMSGRAGRRGIDERGTVVLMMDEKLSSEDVKKIMMGTADPLNSAFHLTYNMILNLLRLEEINPEYMIEKSFLLFQTRAKILALDKGLKYKQQDLDGIHIQNEPSVASYLSNQMEMEELHRELHKFIIVPKYLKPFMQEGRLLKIKTEHECYDWGLLSSFKKPNKKSLKLRVMVNVHNKRKNEVFKPSYTKKRSHAEIIIVDYSDISQISSEIHPLPKNKKCQDFFKIIQTLKHRYPNGLPLLHPVDDMKIKMPEVAQLVKKISERELVLFNHDITTFPTNEKCKDLHLLRRKNKILENIAAINEELSTAYSVIKMDELQSRKEVLRNLSYCNEIDVINVKGRVACEISGGDELLLTEMIFNGAFTKLPVEYCVAIVSCFTSAEISYVHPNLDSLIQEALCLVETLAKKIGNIACAARVITNSDEYLETFSKFLIEVVLSWCKGASFLDVCKMTDIYEGSIIRSMRMLEEILRQLCRAARNIGNIELENKFSEGIRILKKGVVFAGSLYL